jgi:hypothetical protein
MDRTANPWFHLSRLSALHSHDNEWKSVSRLPVLGSFICGTATLRVRSLDRGKVGYHSLHSRTTLRRLLKKRDEQLAHLLWLFLLYPVPQADRQQSHRIERRLQHGDQFLELLDGKVARLANAFCGTLDDHKVDWVARDLQNTAPHCKLHQRAKQIANVRPALG